jgi:hypothetical protein
VGLSLGADLEEKDIANISASEYAKYSLSPFKQGKRSIPAPDVFQVAARLDLEAAAIWQERLASITPAQITEIFARIPEDRITPAAAKFAQDLLAHNRERILSLNLLPKKNPQQIAIDRLRNEYTADLNNEPTRPKFTNKYQQELYESADAIVRIDDDGDPSDRPELTA